VAGSGRGRKRRHDPAFLLRAERHFDRRDRLRECAHGADPHVLYASVGTVSPASGSGSSQVFSIQAIHPDGNALVTGVEVLITANDGIRCHFYYARNPGLLYLAAEDESRWLPPGAVGTGGVVQHSYCGLDTTAAVVSASGTTLTLNVPLSFKPAFGGSRDMYVNVYSNGLNSGWQKKAAWTVPVSSGPPAIDSVSPASGAGSSQVFTSRLSYSGGGSLITAVEMLITGNDGARCHAFWLTSTGSLYLATENESRWLGPALLGTGGRVGEPVDARAASGIHPRLCRGQGRVRHRLRFQRHEHRLAEEGSLDSDKLRSGQQFVIISVHCLRAWARVVAGPATLYDRLVCGCLRRLRR
jgi:hypothetical protein